MSIFSGKCDLYDWFADRSAEHIKKSIIHIGDKTIKNIKPYELVPYYPYIIASGGMNNTENGFSIVHIVPPHKLANVYIQRWMKELKVCGYSDEEIDCIISKIDIDNV